MAMQRHLSSSPLTACDEAFKGQHGFSPDSGALASGDYFSQSYRSLDRSKIHPKSETFAQCSKIKISF
jgi:hypothetical protein